MNILEEKLCSIFHNSIFYSENLQLDSIVHIQQNVDGRFQQYPEAWQTIYFVELDIRRKLKGLVNNINNNNNSNNNNNNNNNNNSKETITRFSQLVHIMNTKIIQPQKSVGTSHDNDRNSDQTRNGKHKVQSSVQVNKNNDSENEPNGNKDTTLGAINEGDKQSRGVGNLCFMADWQWREDVDIEILTPIRNQIQWLEYLLIMVKRVLDKTGESKVCGVNSFLYQISVNLLYQPSI